MVLHESSLIHAGCLLERALDSMQQTEGIRCALIHAYCSRYHFQPRPQLHAWPALPSFRFKSLPRRQARGPLTGAWFRQLRQLTTRVALPATYVTQRGSQQLGQQETASLPYLLAPGQLERAARCHASQNMMPQWGWPWMFRVTRGIATSRCLQCCLKLAILWVQWQLMCGAGLLRACLLAGWR